MRISVAAMSYSRSQSTTRTGSGIAWLARLFSFPVMCMFLLAAVIFGFCVKQFAEPDMWWHLRYARDLVQLHTFSSFDTYSFTAAGAFRPNFEWLSELPFYVAYHMAGLHGVLLLYFGILVLMFAGVYYLSCSDGADCKNATVATLIGIFLCVVSIGPRTLLFGWLCMVGLLLVLDRFRRSRTGLWLLPPLFLLWINLHPSWAFGLVVFLLTIGAGLVDGEWGLVEATKWSRDELRKLAIAFVASVMVLFVNPFGYRLVLYPFQFLFQQQSNVRYVEEWQGVDFSTSNGKLALLVLLGLLAANVFLRRRWRLDQALLCAFALWAALSHSRFLFFAGLVLPPILAQRLNLFPPYEPELDKPWLNGIIMAAIVASPVFFFPSNAALQQQLNENFPTAALAFMQRQHLNGRIFNQYRWGGFMEWNSPELKPFIDGRADIFVDKGVLDDHRRVTLLDDPFGVLDKYRIDYVLVQSDGAITYLLNHSQDWHPLYADNVAVLFARSEAAVTQAPIVSELARTPN